MFENTALVERFLNYWRTTGHQRLGYLYGTYEMNNDVPLGMKKKLASISAFHSLTFVFWIGIRAHVAAIYEPPQESNRDSIKLLEDEHGKEVDEFAAALGLKKVSSKPNFFLQ